MVQQAIEPMAAGEVLSRSAIFGALSASARAELAACLETLTVPAGSVVVQEDQEADRYYLIGAGEATVWAIKGAAPAKDSAGRGGEWVPDPQRHAQLSHLGPGNGFGETALLLGGRRRATVLATTDLVLYTLDRATFTRIVNQHRVLAVALEEDMALRGVVTFLGRTSPFATLAPDVLRWLSLRLQPLSFEAGQEIVREGEPGDAFYIVRTGQVEVLGRLDDGGAHRITTLGAGDPFGEQALVTGEPRSATVRAVGPVEALRLSREDFEAVLRQHRDRGSYFLQLTLQRQRPRRIEHWTLERLKGRDDEVVYILKDTQHNRYLKLSEQSAFLWDLMDGQRTVRDLTMAYLVRYQLFGLDAVMGCMMALHAAGFVRIQRIDTQRIGELATLNLLQRVGLRLMPWLIHYVALPDLDGVVTLLYRYLLRPLYSRLGLAFLFVVTVSGAAIFARYLVLGGIHPPRGSIGQSVVFAGILGFLLQGFLHEVAHAATCKHFGREVHRAGVGWYLFLPVAFVDTSDMWLAGRRPRAAVAFAGPYSNFVLSGLAALLLSLTADPTMQSVLFQFALVGYVLGLVNLNPLLEFDGYYVLMDLLDVPNLRAKALVFLGAVLWRAGRTTRDPRLARIFTIYGLLALIYTLFLVVTVFSAYHQHVEGALDHVLPRLVSGFLGWSVAGLMAWLILARSWGDVRKGARQTQRTRLQGGSPVAGTGARGPD